jgi:ferric-dicitrate binding protein FerR (iron transport regulator)
VRESSRTENAIHAENRARAAAELVLASELLPGPVPLPDFASLMAGRSRWRRRGWTLGAVGALGGVALATVVMLREHAPISYVVDGTVAISDDVIDAAGAPGAASSWVRFSEGTEVGLAPGARLRVVHRTTHGAALALDRGRARFAVTHRSDAHWSVATGPFTIDVVGTRFSLDWSPHEKRLQVDLTSGSVQVRGASVGGPVSMHPGERLVATAADRRVTLSPLVEASDPRPGSSAVASDKAATATDTETVAAVVKAPAMPARAPSRSLRRSSHRNQLALAVPARARPPEPAAMSSSAHPLPSGSGTSGSAQPRSAPSPLNVPEPPGLLGPPPEPPRPLPQPTVSSTLGAGGTACAHEGSQYRFERTESGISIPDFYTLAFSSPRTDRTRSWCGQASLRVDANFNDSGRRNFFGRYPQETGEVVIKLHRATDFTGKTVTVHFFVDGPSDARFTAELVVVNRGRWVNGPPSSPLAAGKWLTISHRFEAENESGVRGSSNPGPFPVGGTSPVSSCDRLGLAIHSTGSRRVWTAAVYIDDVGWK